MARYDLLKGDAVIASGAEPWVYTPEDGGLWTSGNIGVRDVADLKQAVNRTTMTPIRFEEQFTFDEQIEIEDRRAYVPGSNPDKAVDGLETYTKRILDLLFGKLKDPRLTEVDVADPSVLKGIGFCQMIGVLTDERAETIRQGVTQPVA